MSNWSIPFIDWMGEREMALPVGLEENLGGPGFNPGWVPEGKYEGEEVVKRSHDLCLLEQFMVSGMNEAVFEMVKAGYPKDVDTPMIISLSALYPVLCMPLSGH